MSYCAVFSYPNGATQVLRPNQALVGVLMLPTWREAESALVDRGILQRLLSALGLPSGGRLRIGLRPDVVRPLYDAMTQRTEREAVRVIAERDAPRVALSAGLVASAVRDLAVVEETGLLEPGRGDEARVNRQRRFRACWRRTGMAAPAVDMPLARAHRMNEVRVERAPILDRVDKDINIATDAGDMARVRQLRDIRQALRDLPATVAPELAACATPEALAAWTPAWPTPPAP